MMTQQSTQYGKLEYWQKFYARNQDKYFDWYQRFDKLKNIITQYITKESKILMVGAGNSSLSEDMLLEGYKNITNIDFSSVIVNEMQKRYAQMDLPSTFTYVLQDVRDMVDFEDESFDCVIDKGTLDCVLCAEYSSVESKRMLSEVSRVLTKKGGIYMCITYGVKDHRLKYLDDEERYSWSLMEEADVYKLYKPVSHDEKIAPIEDDPTKKNTDQQKFNTEYNAENYHYVYVCKKTKGKTHIQKQ